MNGLAGATIKDYLQVRIPDPGIPTVAYFATVGTGAIAALTLEAGQIALKANIPVVASFATTEASESITRFFETDSVVKHCLTTGHRGNCQGLLNSSSIPTRGLGNPKLAINAGRCSR